MSNPSGTIHDGMTRKGFIPARTYVCPDLRFQYRPMTGPCRVNYFQKLEAQQTAVGREVVAVAQVAIQLLEWDLKYDSRHPDPQKRGMPVPIDPDVIYNQVDPYIQRMVNAIIVGTIASSPDPNDPADERAAVAEKQGLSPREMFNQLAKEEAERTKNLSEGSGS